MHLTNLPATIFFLMRRSAPSGDETLYAEFQDIQSNRKEFNEPTSYLLLPLICANPNSLINYTMDHVFATTLILEGERMPTPSRYSDTEHHVDARRGALFGRRRGDDSS